MASEERKLVAQNRRARHDYEILETFEAGIVLQGAEIKSIRMSQVQLKDAYARVEDGEMWLFGMHIAPYEYAHGFGAFEPTRKRKLLVHRRQIDQLHAQTTQQSFTLVPLALYLNKGRAKIDIAVARGRRTYDKRQALAKRESDREAARAISDLRKGR